ncbi:hypothetical protein IX296_003052 [Bacteroides pyogenes]|nr:hypothetical protein [Bacteroides pyogenes]MBR8725435.1 hypothetical protein [Bacteroides pyogenes]MBR8740053.1 hypothetical protein [Bacteroides pyogenes]MBR8755806.1 hypothetical protein [Bacteroides pyogenes]MBR8796017.1 hypothetical protein [Bacteroides pyogenes]
MTYRLTARAFPNGEVWFFEKEVREKYGTLRLKLRNK